MRHAFNDLSTYEGQWQVETLMLAHVHMELRVRFKARHGAPEQTSNCSSSAGPSMDHEECVAEHNMLFSGGEEVELDNQTRLIMKRMAANPGHPGQELARETLKVYLIYFY